MSKEASEGLEGETPTKADGKSDESIKSGNPKESAMEEDTGPGAQSKGMPSQKGEEWLAIEFPNWECEFEDVEKFTVGDKKKLICYGDYIERLKEPIKLLVNDKRLEFILHPLELISSENESVTLLVTSYKSGKFSNFNFIIVEEGVASKKAVGFQVKSLSWEVQSVIENPQMPQGFGPSQPFYLSMPWWYWGGWTLALAFVVVVVGYKFFRSLERKKVIESLATHKTSLSPYNQYHREMRQMAREYQNANYMKQIEREGSAGEYLLELDRVLRLYLVRQLQVPALNWSGRQIVREIKHRHKSVFKSVGSEIEQTLREFEKALRPKVKVGMLDCNQFHQMSRRMVEQIYKLVRP